METDQRLETLIANLRSIGESVAPQLGVNNAESLAATLLEAFAAVPLYTQELDWGEDGAETERAPIDVCVGCGFPGQGDHDGAPEACPVGRLEILLRENT